MTSPFLASFVLFSLLLGCVCIVAIPFPVAKAIPQSSSSLFWVTTSSTGTGPIASRSDYKLYLTVNWNGTEYDNNNKHPVLKITSPNGQSSITYGSMPAAVPLKNTLSRSSAKVLPGTLYIYDSVYQFVTDVWRDGGASLGYDSNDMWNGDLTFTWNNIQTTNPTFLSNTPYVTYADWMAHSVVQDKTLRQLVIPGTHDSDAFYGDSFMNREQSVTQVDNFSRQLLDGVRYFDLRVRYFSGNSEPFWLVHASDRAIYYDPYVSLQSLLDAVNSFTNAHPKEVVMLDFNHFYNGFTQDLVNTFAGRIKASFGSKLIPTDKTNKTFNHSDHGFVVDFYAPNQPLRTYISNHQQIVIGFQPMFDNDWSGSLNTQMISSMTINGLFYLAHFDIGRWEDTNLDTEIELWKQDIKDFTKDSSYTCTTRLWVTGSAYSAPSEPLSPYRDSNPSNVHLSLWALSDPNFKYANVVRTNFFTGSLTRYYAIYYSQTPSNRNSAC